MPVNQTLPKHLIWVPAGRTCDKNADNSTKRAFYAGSTSASPALSEMTMSGGELVSLPKLRPSRPNLSHAVYGFVKLLAIGLCLGTSATVAMADTLKIYAAQHEQTVNILTQAFTNESGIDVAVRFGEPPELASQLFKEGAASPADVFFTANSPELERLSEEGLLARVAPATLARVPSQDNGPNGDWVGVLARENVLVYNTGMLQAGSLPSSLLDLAKPAWKDKVAIAPTDADFLPLIGAVEVMSGRDAALAWLKGLRANAVIYDDNEAVVAAVDRGAVATGIINNYYWPRLRLEKGADNIHSAISHFAGGDVGGLVNISGAAVLKSSTNQGAAQRFLAFLVEKSTQELLSKTDVTFEYPLVSGVTANPMLRPFAQLQPPKLTIKQIGNDSDAVALLREAGLI
jgi:iron(III) transport system substrate-binding protein